ncbi:MAG TPA: flagellar hook-associated protein FlgK [Lachnospiraceae bacterium]|nr:flagellar hook-associated protein FlgK [Lachnospiraceae bacterium]
MPLMGNLYIGASGLQASQNALNATAHNMSNMSTTGYVRQQVLLGTREYNTISVNASSVSNQQLGLGVEYSKVRQVRDAFLDQTYRKESGRSAFYEVSYNTMSEVENLLGELDGSSFSDSLGNLWTSVQELANNPTSATNQGLLVQRASEFLEKATSVYSGLTAYQDNLNLQIKSSVDIINTYGKQLVELNDKIRKIETGGIESANDLRDARNQIIDKLSRLVNISYAEDTTGNITVKIEGEDFVTKDNVYEIAVDEDPNTGFYTPFWPNNAKYTLDADGNKKYTIENAKVFNMNQTISTDMNTDIGSVKSMLFARGDHKGNYTDLLNEEKYNSNISQSILMNIQAEFDQLIHAVVTSINKVLEDASDSDNNYLCNSDGSPLQLFTKISGVAYVEDPITGDWIYQEEDINNPNKTETLYSVMNLQINGELEKQPSKLSFRLPDGSEDNETVEKLKAAFKNESHILNPNLKLAANFVDYYSNLVSQVANSGAVFRSILYNQEQTVEATNYAREQIIGVSQDEELTNMIKFQNAFNASSRYINVIDEMLEHIINTLGR